MIKALGRAAALFAAAAAVLFALATPALAQAPTDAQRSAIRSACRADYQANCSSVPPGGMASLQCLQQNLSSLSPSCQTAVRAVATPAEPKAEAKPEAKPESAPAAAAKEEPAAAPVKPEAETAAPPKAASTAAKKPSSAQIAAIRSACRSDYRRVCAGVPTGGAAALQCLEKNTSKVSANCAKAVSAASGGAATPAGAASADPAAAPAAAPAPVLVLRPMRPREILFVLRSACGADVRTLCAGVPPGGGRIIECLATQSASLSPACSNVLGQFAAQ
jgi:hypothetical protein